jgi:hypothetical protein
MLYTIYDLTLDSNITLPLLTRAEGGEPDCTFQLLPAQETAPIPYNWFYHWQLPDEDPWLSFAKKNSDYLLRFPNLADFTVSNDGRSVVCHPVPGIPLETIRHLLIDQVIPLLLSKQEKLALHASAVVSDEGAIAFMGMTGRGKSTLAASFSKNLSILTDDCLLLKRKNGQVFGLPSYPGLRLWPDSILNLFDRQPNLCQVAHYTEKQRIGSGDADITFFPQDAPMRRVYVLQTSDGSKSVDGVQIVKLSPQSAFMELVKHAYRIDVHSPENLRNEFNHLTELAALPIFYSLKYPRDLSCLSLVRQAVLKNLRSA